MTAVIYARYSSDNQREESIEGQIRECTAYAEKNGIHALRNQQASIGVAQAMHTQIQRQVVSLQNQLESVCECAGIHRFAVRLAEQVVIVVHGFVCSLFPIPLALFPQV